MTAFEWAEWSLLLTGLTVVHATWQTGVAALAVALLRYKKHAGPRLRYAASLALFFGLPVLAVVSALWVADAAPASEIALEAEGVLPTSASLVAAWGPWVGVIWLVGVTSEAFRLTRRALRARTLARGGESAGEELEARVLEHARRLGVAHRPAILLSRELSVPAVVGLRHPTLLVPVDLASTLRADEVDAILTHELSHVRRRDLFAYTAQRAVRALLFFHPVARWLSGVIDQERELCCDDLVTGTGIPARTYARALTRVALSVEPGPGLAASSGDIVRRVRRLMRPPLPHASAQVLVPAALLVLSTLTGSAAIARTLAPVTERAARGAPAWQARMLASTPQDYTVNATDPAGVFTLSVKNGRAVAATVDGRALAPGRIRQRGAQVTLDPTPETEGSRFSVRLLMSGGIEWPARSASAGTTSGSN